MTSFSTLLSVHLISIALSVGLLTLRFWLRYQKHPQAFARWTRIVPPVVDTLLLLSGIALMAKAHIQPFSGQAQWLTEKLFGVIIYIVLGFIALDYRRMHSQQARIIAFPLALGQRRKMRRSPMQRHWKHLKNWTMAAVTLIPAPLKT